MIIQGQTVITVHNKCANENQYCGKNSYDRKLVAEEVAQYLFSDY
jgi:hypothetical protein